MKPLALGRNTRGIIIMADSYPFYSLCRQDKGILRIVQGYIVEELSLPIAVNMPIKIYVFRKSTELS
jgi:hypothetical protein